MSIDYEEMRKALEEFPETPAGKAYFKNMAIKHEIKLGRYKKFEKYLETHDFDELMYKLILEHGEEWREKCWHNGYEVHPNNKLAFIIDYVVNNFEPVKVPQLENDFHNHIWFFKGYYFQMTWGQGVLTDIYNKEDLRHLLQV